MCQNQQDTALKEGEEPHLKGRLEVGIIEKEGSLSGTKESHETSPAQRLPRP